MGYDFELQKDFLDRRPQVRRRWGCCYGVIVEVGVGGVRLLHSLLTRLEFLLERQLESNQPRSCGFHHGSVLENFPRTVESVSNRWLVPCLVGEPSQDRNNR